MSSTTVLPLLVLLYLSKVRSSNNVDCMVEISPTSDNSDGAQTNVSCSDPDYTLLSCGHRMVDPQEEYFIGSWIEGQTCWAKNESPSDGVYAIARCCNLSSYSFSCHTIESEQSSGDNDDRSHASCAIDETLMGCTVRCVQNWNDGSYPGSADLSWVTIENNNIVIPKPTACIGVNEIYGGGVWSYATCCASSKILMECEAVWSGQLDADSTVDETMSCPKTDQFMTSCSAVTSWGFINGWEVNTNNECQISKSVTKYKFPDVFYKMVAICCSIETLDPTAHPTLYPTSETLQPTIDPSHPTLYPTIPTTHPTTADPSSDPTLPPTTADPSSDPTLPPTTDPIQDPTIDPLDADEILNELEGKVNEEYGDINTTIDDINSTMDDQSVLIPLVIIGLCVVTIAAIIGCILYLYCNYLVKKCENHLANMESKQDNGNTESETETQSNVMNVRNEKKEQNEDSLSDDMYVNEGSKGEEMNVTSTCGYTNETNNGYDKEKGDNDGS